MLAGGENRYSGTSLPPALRATFDGQGNSITGFALNMATGGDWGLFGFVSNATVKSFSISGTAVSELTAAPSEFDYGVIGEATGSTVVTDVHSSVNLTIKDSFSRNTVAGILGRNNSTGADFAIERCSFSGTLDLGAAVVDCTGGILAYAMADHVVKINNCLFSGTIISTSSGARQIGGMMGYYRGQNLMLTNCLSIGTITSTDSTLNGMLLGVLRQHSSANTKVINNYYTGTQPFGNSEKSDDITDGHGSQTVAGSAAAVTNVQLQSGEVAYLLGEAWGQTPGVGVPALDGPVVYLVTNCQNEAIYANVNKNGLHTPEATWTANQDGKTHSKLCTLCGGATETEEHSGGTATCTTTAKCAFCGSEYDSDAEHDSTIEYVEGFCPNGCYEPAVDSDGDGYYEIGNAGQLYWFASQVNGGNTSISAILTADIVVNRNVLTQDGKLNGDGSNFRVWTPIGGVGSNWYGGFFNGNGHTISGLYFNDSTVDYVGLFGTIGNGYVQRVGVVDSYFCGGNNVGGLAGMNYNTVIYCYSTATVIGSFAVGGLVGYNRYGVISECYSTGTVSGSSSVGGVVGYSKVDDGGWVENCFYLGTEETDSESGTTAKTAAQFASGEVAYLLQAAAAENGYYDDNGEWASDSFAVWGQTCGIGLPAVGGPTVYQVTD